MSTPLPLLLAMAFRLLIDRLHERLAAEGEPIRPVHGFTISHLMNTDGATAVELAAYLGITKQGAAHIVGELEQSGHVERIDHPTDRRSRLVVVTEKGRSLVTRAAQIWAEEEANWANLVGADRLEDVRDALQTFVTAGGDEAFRLRPVW
ncbi:winged helix-turn-helix transcriptional regulator [Amycolatopsis rhizosphaerae]|uniref:Winged helix-turn-helix transcriptional regulator n=2 Tax=Amycolatopsis rhizosphaerae TaxID=2053003 RepID=A0A558CFX5_9PSEU|nr:winged helix-turn-helix transcriptional regulator [Amycolatopsis rhizosphaerae]